MLHYDRDYFIDYIRFFFLYYLLLAIFYKCLYSYIILKLIGKVYTMKLTQLKNRTEEQKLVEFFDTTVNAFIADPTSTNRVEYVAPRKAGESGLYRVKLNRLLEVSTSLESGEMYKLMIERESRAFYYRPDFNQITSLRKFSEQELADYKARKEAERAAEEAKPEIDTTKADDDAF